jgi:hypothetical protein
MLSLKTKPRCLFSDEKPSEAKDDDVEEEEESEEDDSTTDAERRERQFRKRKALAGWGRTVGFSFQQDGDARHSTVFSG